MSKSLYPPHEIMERPEAYLLAGPPFRVSELAEGVMLVLGHSEHRRIGGPVVDAFMASEFADGHFFPLGCEIVTKNDLYSRRKRPPIDDFASRSLVIGLSAADQELPSGLQAILMNPTKQIGGYLDQLIRAYMVSNEPSPIEPKQAWVGGPLGLATAAIEFFGHPKVSLVTMSMLYGDHNYAKVLVERRRNGEFPEGLMVAHSLYDSFGFGGYDDYRMLAHASGYNFSGYLIDNHVHNGVILAPELTFAALKRAIAKPIDGLPRLY